MPTDPTRHRAPRSCPYCHEGSLHLEHDTRWGCGLLIIGMAAVLALVLFPLGTVVGVPLGVFGAMTIRRNQYEACSRAWACGYRKSVG